MCLLLGKAWRSSQAVERRDEVIGIVEAGQREQEGLGEISPARQALAES